MEETYIYYVLTLLLAATNLSHSFRLMYQKNKRDDFKITPDLISEDDKLFFKMQIPEAETIGAMGQGLVLDCEAGGSPSPTIHWLYRGVRVKQNNRDAIEDDEALYENTKHNSQVETLKLGSTKSRLYIDCLSAEQEGMYTCIAETPYRRISTTTLVKIDNSMPNDYFDTCVRKRIGADAPPRIFMWTAQRLEFEGADVQLFCRSEGSPAVNTKWLDQRGNAITTDNQQYSLLVNGDLLIRRINWMDNMGLYTCIVNNEHGQDQVAIFLYPVSPQPTWSDVHQTVV